MRKLAICTLGILSVWCALAPAAGAEKPAREFIPAEDFVIKGSCSFDVAVHIVANNEYGITFSNGATLVTGTLKVTLTNVRNTSKSITLNISGPGLFTFPSDGSLAIDAHGPWLFFFDGVLSYSVGHSHLNVSAAGVFSLTQLGGTSTDICAVLQ